MHYLLRWREEEGEGVEYVGPLDPSHAQTLYHMTGRRGRVVTGLPRTTKAPVVSINAFRKRLKRRAEGESGR